MNKQDYVHLLSERTALRRMIEDTPEDEVIDRGSMMGRLEEVDDELAAAKVDERASARLVLTFSGEPVEASRSIEAQFGGKAVALFTEAVALTAASFSGAELKKGGPVPGGKERHLRIVGAAVGSFGFELELPPPEPDDQQGQLPDREAEAVETTLARIEQSMSGDDDALSERMSTVDLRAGRKLGEFVKLAIDRGALFTVRFGERRVAIPDYEAGRRVVAALRTENIKQDIVTERATLTGLRAAKPDFECSRESDGAVLLGTIDRSVDVTRLKALLGKVITVELRETRLRAASPRYVLIGFQEPPTA